jgi:hypothetical protein
MPKTNLDPDTGAAKASTPVLLQDLYLPSQARLGVAASFAASFIGHLLSVLVLNVFFN